jgi:hypothetical protein
VTLVRMSHTTGAAAHRAEASTAFQSGSCLPKTNTHKQKNHLETQNPTTLTPPLKRLTHHPTALSGVLPFPSLVRRGSLGCRAQSQSLRVRRKGWRPKKLSHMHRIVQAVCTTKPRECSICLTDASSPHKASRLPLQAWLCVHPCETAVRQIEHAAPASSFPLGPGSPSKKLYAMKLGGRAPPRPQSRPSPSDRLRGLCLTTILEWGLCLSTNLERGLHALPGASTPK